MRYRECTPQALVFRVTSVARRVAEHLADASLCGVESHGLMRVLQYHEQFANGIMQATASPQYKPLPLGHEIDGNQGVGIPALQLAL